MSAQNGSAPTRLYLRDLRVAEVVDAIREHRPRTAEQVLRLPSLRHMAGECIAVAVADAVCLGMVAQGPSGELILLAKIGPTEAPV